MPTFPLTGLSRGISDHFMAGRGAQRMKNFVLDQAGNPVQRGGQAVWGTAGRIPASQKITDLPITSHAGFDYVYAHSAGNIYTALGTDQLELVGPLSWAAVLGDNSTKPGDNSDIYTRALFQGVDAFDYVSFWGFPSNYLTHPKVKRILPGFSGAGSSFNMGLPVPTNGNVVASAGAGVGFTYIYYLVFVFTYTIDSITYTERSAPQGPFTLSFVGQIGGGATADITTPTVNGSAIYNPAFQNYPAATKVEVYRTEPNETVPYLHAVRDPTLADPPIETHDQGITITDNVLFTGTVPLYTVDGTAPFDEPPPCSFFHVVNDIGYYGGFFSGSRYSANTSLQSVPGILYSAPSDFEVIAPEAITGGISSNDVYPIYFCQNSLWRLEGQIDSYGNGAPIFRLISDKIGCKLPPTVKKFGRTVSFVGTDGSFYVTDGFTLKKLTDHLSRTLGLMYRNFTTQQNYAQAGGMGSAVDVRTGRIFYSFSLSGALPTPYNTGIYCVDPRFDVDGGAAVTEFEGRTHETLGEIFRPQGMSFIGASLVFGNQQGYPMILRPEPIASTDTVDDVMPNTAVATNLWASTAVVPDWISQAYDYGLAKLTKITTALTTTFSLLFEQTALAVDFYSYREGKYRSEAVKTEEMQLASVRETALNPAEQTFSAWRRMRRQGLRAVLRQFRIKKGYVVQYSSDGTGYGRAAINTTLNTAQLTGFSWPTDVIGSYLHLEATNYTRAHLITAVSGDTLTLHDPSSLLPETGGPFRWEIKSYPLNQRLSVLSAEVDYFALGTPLNAPSTEAAGTNERSL